MADMICGILFAKRYATCWWRADRVSCLPAARSNGIRRCYRTSSLPLLQRCRRCADGRFLLAVTCSWRANCMYSAFGVLAAAGMVNHNALAYFAGRVLIFKPCADAAGVSRRWGTVDASLLLIVLPDVFVTAAKITGLNRHCHNIYTCRTVLLVTGHFARDTLLALLYRHLRRRERYAGTLPTCLAGARLATFVAC